MIMVKAHLIMKIFLHMFIALACSIKVWQTHPAYVSVTGLTGHMVASFILFDWYITLGASFAVMWILTHPFLKLFIITASWLVHGTAESIVILYMAFCAHCHSTVTTDKSFPIIWDNVHHVTIWGWAAMNSLPIGTNVTLEWCCNNFMLCGSSSQEEVPEILPDKLLRAMFSCTLDRKSDCIGRHLHLNALETVWVPTVLQSDDTGSRNWSETNTTLHFIYFCSWSANDMLTCAVYSSTSWRREL